MRLRKKQVMRLAGLAAAVVLGIGLVAPRLDADRFGERVKASLRQALGREVEIGKVRLDLFGGPGFSVDKVVVYDDPSISAEPFAYVESLTARVSFASFWTGRLQFSSLSLDNASINLARPAAGHWNFESLLSRTAGAAVSAARTGGTTAAPPLPDIHVSGSRINVKLANAKSIFYLGDVRLDVNPPSSSAGDWTVRLEGEPARTDRGSQGFGRFTARGRWRPAAGNGGQIDATIEVADNSLSDLTRLFHGHDIGVHGHITSRAHLVGPLSDVQIAGSMQLSDVHRWDLLPPHGDTWPLDYRGTLDLIGQTLRMETTPAAAATPLPIGVAFRASGYLSDPRWAMLVTLDHLPAAPLPTVARHMGLELPEALSATGDLTGVVGYSAESGFQGSLVATKTVVTIPDTPSVELESALVRLAGNAVHLEPANFTAGKQEATVEGDYTWGERAWKARFTAAGMHLAGADAGAPRLFASTPLMEQCTSGTWRGELDYRKNGDAPGEWAGTFRLENATVPVPGVVEPLELASARVTIAGGAATIDHIQGRAGVVAFRGQYRYVPDAPHPHQLQLSIPKLDTEDLERLVMPSLHREENLLTRALRLGRTQIPVWLEARRAEATIEIGSLSVSDIGLDNVRMHLRWEGTDVEATDLTARYGDGAITGRMSASLRRNVPTYRMNLRFRRVNWMGGAWDGRTVLQTSGTGADVLRNLHAEGSFQANSALVGNETEVKDLSGSYVLTLPRGLPVFQISDLQLTLGENAFKGNGATGNDGRLYFDLSDGQTQMRFGATFSPFQLVEMPSAARVPGAL